MSLQTGEATLFRRTKKAPEPVAPSADRVKGPGAKGRPTPTRREAEAAARERARLGTDKKADKKVMRERRSESSAEIRAGMRRGDERYLPPRDQGPVKRFVRDWIDARINIAELVLPMLIVIMALIYSGNESLTRFGNALWSVTLLVVMMDVVWMTVRLRRILRSQFPGQSLKGTTFYAVMRLVQIRPLRMPKPQVKIGGARK